MHDRETFFESGPPDWFDRRFAWARPIKKAVTFIVTVAGFIVLTTQVGPCDVGWKFETKAEAQAAHEPMQKDIDKLKANDEETLRLLREIHKELVP